MLHGGTQSCTSQLLFKLPDCQLESVGLGASQCCQNSWCGEGFVCCRVGHVPRAHEKESPWLCLVLFPATAVTNAERTPCDAGYG